MCVLSDVHRCVGPDEHPEQIIECRHCGTKFEIKPDHCPACDSAEIAIIQVRE